MLVWFCANDTERTYYGSYTNEMSALECKYQYGEIPYSDCLVRLNGRELQLENLQELFPTLMQYLNSKFEDTLIWGFDVDMDNIKCISTSEFVCWPESMSDVYEFIENHGNDTISIRILNTHKIKRTFTVHGYVDRLEKNEYLIVNVNIQDIDFKSGTYDVVDSQFVRRPSDKEVREAAAEEAKEERIKLETSHDIEKFIQFRTEADSAGLRDIPASYTLEQAFSEGNAIIRAGLTKIADYELLDIPKDLWSSITVAEVLQFGWDDLYTTCREILSAILQEVL